uniref:Major facilitator superfamily (MFS) profile domain-containing protein n=1 Tax=Chromera velia CCMP2878 TaxID=1169474 RepID=A0A0G4FG98_9ALVE|eukprot:Cvel_16822.t1-p1 / transcript=Cvel_16822.t1 / gene=Cvel_16822 / organism=Chromera_velia_CCMP2878 / gene_product=MFS-type transporter SLC18B1, putative / transcript_product=MFS-type transporter SLC18B1, putative / location=Cvel_scaffold1314:1667-6468(+) / protein_length=609 / sequence_SO=supercontig / SO=protein_coding / is_pseudo=false
MQSAAVEGHGQQSAGPTFPPHAGEGTSTDPASGASPPRPSLPVGVMILLGIQQFAANMLVSFPGVFLPKEIEQMGFQSGVTGLLFACFPVAVFVSSPAWAFLSRKIGKLPIVYVAIVLEGLCGVLFGLAYVMTEEVHHRLAIMFLTRTCQGIAASAAGTLVLAIAMEKARDREAMVSGVSMTFMSLGFVLGPIVGGALYAAGGFALPFVSVGAAVMSVVLLLPCTVGWPCGNRAARAAPGGVGVREPLHAGAGGEGEGGVRSSEGGGEEEEVTLGLRDFLKPVVIFIGMGMSLGSTSIGFLEPTYAQLLESSLLVKDPRLVALLFSLPAIFVVLSASPVGMLADSGVANKVAMMVGGNSGYFLVFASIGPFEPLAELLHLSPGDTGSFVLVCLGMALFGVTYNFAVVPAAAQLIRLVEEGLEERERERGGERSSVEGEGVKEGNRASGAEKGEEERETEAFTLNSQRVTGDSSRSLGEEEGSQETGQTPLETGEAAEGGGSPSRGSALGGTATHEAVVSGVMSMQTGFFAVGEALGPLLGGYAAEVVSVPTGYFFFGSLLLLYAVSLAVVWVCYANRKTTREERPASASDGRRWDVRQLTGVIEPGLQV